MLARTTAGSRGSVRWLGPTKRMPATRVASALGEMADAGEYGGERRGGGSCGVHPFGRADAGEVRREDSGDRLRQADEWSSEFTSKKKAPDLCVRGLGLLVMVTCAPWRGNCVCD